MVPVVPDVSRLPEVCKGRYPDNVFRSETPLGRVAVLIALCIPAVLSRSGSRLAGELRLTVLFVS